MRNARSFSTSPPEMRDGFRNELFHRGTPDIGACPDDGRSPRDRVKYPVHPNVIDLTP